MSQTRSRTGWTGSGLVAIAVIAGLGAVLLTAAATAPWRTAGIVQVDDLVVSAVAALGAVVCAWLAMSCALGAVCVVGRLLGSGWRGGEAAVRRWAPSLVRRAVATAVGGGLALGLVATGASAATDIATGADAPPLAWTVTTTGQGPGRDGAGTSAPQDRPRVDRTTGHEDEQAPADGHDQHDEQGAHDEHDDTAGRTAPDPTRRAQGSDGTRTPGAARPEAPRTVVVRAGDSLWTIAAEALGPEATAADVADAWPAWYEENRDTIGADPDVIRAGQVLVAPRAAR